MPADDLTLTIRMFDPTEKTDADKRAAWVTTYVAREDIALPTQQFLDKYITPKLSELKALKLS